MTVSSNKCKRDRPPFLHEWDSFKISSMKLKLHWILRASDPLNKFRGIKKRLFFFYFILTNFGNQKKSLWPPIIEQNAPSICNVLGLISVLLENIYVSLALFGEGNVISIVLLKKCAESAFYLFFFCPIWGLFFYYYYSWIFFFFFFTSSLSIMFSGNRKQNEHQQAWIVPLQANACLLRR